MVGHKWHLGWKQGGQFGWESMASYDPEPAGTHWIAEEACRFQDGS